MSAVPGTAQPTKKERPRNGALPLIKGPYQRCKCRRKDAWFMYGPVYLSREFSAKFLPVLEAYYQIPGTEQFYWEQPYVDMLKGEANAVWKRGQGAVETDRRSLRHTCVQMERDRDEYQPPAG